jgi:hypothetical protein
MPIPRKGVISRLLLSLGFAGVCISANAAVTDQIGAELVGQVANPSASQSIQYGYLSLVEGMPRISTQSGPVTETTALLTFYSDTTTDSVTNNGPMRTIDRTGTITIYYNDSGNSTFSNPDSFRTGTPILVATLHHQVVIDTITGSFVTTFENTITNTSLFQVDNMTYRLGKPGRIVRINVFGHLNAQAPPAAYIMGFVSGAFAETLQ